VGLYKKAVQGFLLNHSTNTTLQKNRTAIPSGAGTLFFIQTFATLGFAVLYSTLVLYATKKLGFSEADADAIMGVFGAFNYGLHMFGGYLGGRYLSNRNLFVLGMVLQVLGCGLIAMEGVWGLYWGLAMFLTGSGLNVTCLNMMLTQRFAPDDDRRESAFLWNYAGMNLGFFIIDLFYHTWGFGGAGGVYLLSEAIWLDKVLATRRGTPVSLGVIFLHIAHALELPLMPVIFPTQLILRADWMDEQMWLINPINGETLNEHMLEIWLKGNLGVSAEIEDDDLEEAEHSIIVQKMLDTLKAALMEEKQMEMALRASQTVLQFDPEDPYEIRDRGLIYAQLGCNHVAISDLNYFVEQCPEDPISEVIKLQIHSIEDHQVVLH